MNIRRIILAELLAMVFISITAQTKYEVKSKRIDIFEQPSDNAKIIGQKVEGDLIDVYSTFNGWAIIQYQNTTGYVDLYCVKPLDEEEEALPLQLTTAQRPTHNQPTSPNKTILQGGTEIHIQCTNEITAKKAKIGDIVAFRVSRNVIVDGHVVIPVGTPVEGRVYEVQTIGQYQKEKHLKNKELNRRYIEGTLGKLSVTIENIILPKGLVIPLVADVQGFYNAKKSDFSFKQKTIPAGHEIIATVAAPVTINIDK